MNFFDKQNIRLVLKEFDYQESEFIAFIYSSWHLDMFYSWIQANKLTKGSILVLPQSDVKDSSRFRLSNSNFIHELGDDTSVYFIHEMSLSFQWGQLMKIAFKNRRGIDFYIFNPGGVNYLTLSNLRLRGRRIIYLQIDEGTSTYFPEGKKGLLLSDRPEKSLRDQITQPIRKWFKYSFSTIFNKLSPLSFKKYYLFRKEKSFLLPNPDVAVNLKEYYSTMYTRSLKIAENSILVLKDFDAEILPKAMILDMYKNLFTRLIEPGHKVYLKKHPNDQDSLFDKMLKEFQNVEHLKSEFSVEALIPAMKPQLVLGGISTSLFTIPCIFNIPTISYMQQYKNYSQLNPLYADRINMLHTFFHNVSPNFQISNSWNEIKIS